MGMAMSEFDFIFLGEEDKYFRNIEKASAEKAPSRINIVKTLLVSPLREWSLQKKISVGLYIATLVLLIASSIFYTKKKLEMMERLLDFACVSAILAVIIDPDIDLLAKASIAVSLGAISAITRRKISQEKE